MYGDLAAKEFKLPRPKDMGTTEYAMIVEFLGYNLESFREEGDPYGPREAYEDLLYLIGEIEGVMEQLAKIGKINHRPIPNSIGIKSYLHCGHCLLTLPKGKTPREWAELEVGYTELGLQVWCKRHESNVVHIDFEGRTHRANTTSKRKERGNGSRR